MIDETPTDRLRLLARAAIVATKGNTEAALERLDKTITQADDAALERTLTALYRTTALRALLATHYNELRAEGRITHPRGETRIDTTNYDRTRERSTTWAARRVTQIEKNATEERIAYEKQLLDRFYIDGKPLGDCTATQARDRAAHNERDAVFLRRVSHGLPDDGVIRDYLKPDEVDEQACADLIERYQDRVRQVEADRRPDDWVFGDVRNLRRRMANALPPTRCPEWLAGYRDTIGGVSQQ